MITFNTEHKKILISIIISIFVLLLLLITNEAKTADDNPIATIQLNPKVIFQTIDTIGSWESNATGGQPKGLAGGRVSFPIYQNELIERSVNELGLNRLRLEYTAVSENPTTDWWQEYQSGAIDYTRWRTVRGESINDNNDPNVFNWNAFHFGNVDTQVESLVLPMKKLLEAKGENLHINLCFVDFRMGPLEHGSNPDEYAETILAVFLHLKNKYDLVPDSLEIALEPDNSSSWKSGTTVGINLVAAAQRLEKNGFKPKIIAPSTLNTSLASSYFDEMIKIPDVLNYLEVISYHRYAGVSESSIMAIGQRAKQYGLDSAMLEQIGYGYKALHEDLKKANVSAWTQWSLAAVAGNSMHQYFVIDEENPQNPKLQLPKRSQFYSQYFKYIRAGAVRIDATTEDENFDPVTFINKDGGYVAVVIAKQAGRFSIHNLPSATYGIRYTTPSEYAVNLTNIFVSSDGVLSTEIPQEGVITIYRLNPTNLTENPQTTVNFDFSTGILNISSVNLLGSNISYEASLFLIPKQGDLTFQLSNIEQLDSFVQGQLASFNSQNGILSLPSVNVSGDLYSVKMKRVEGSRPIQFTLLEAVLI